MRQEHACPGFPAGTHCGKKLYINRQSIGLCSACERKTPEWRNHERDRMRLSRNQYLLGPQIATSVPSVDQVKIDLEFCLEQLAEVEKLLNKARIELKTLPLEALVYVSKMQKLLKEVSNEIDPLE